MADVAFVLLREAVQPDPAGVVATARELGLELTFDEQSGDLPTYALAGGGTLVVALRPPLPDPGRLPTGPTAVPPAEATAACAHLVLTALGLGGALRQRDLRLASLTAAVMEHVPAVGAKLGHGVVFHRAPLFRELARRGAEQGALPVELAVDVTAARESATHMSFLSHGLARYGGEELYVVCPLRGTGALNVMLGVMRQLHAEPSRRLQTGDVIEREASGPVPVQRVPSPTGEGGEVLRLDLPT